MLIVPYLLKGIAALKSAFVLVANTSASWYSYADNRPRLPTISPGVIMFTAAVLTLQAVVRNTLDSIEPYPLHQPTQFEYIPFKPAPANPAPDSYSGIASYDAVEDVCPAVTVLNVPELDWTIPGAPTLRVLKVEEPNSDVLYVTDYIPWMEGLGPARSTFRSPFPPVVPDDEIPSMPRYEHPFLTFGRRCRRKVFINDVGLYQMNLIMGIRLSILIETLRNVLYDIYPIPGLILQAWRICRAARRRYVPRTWREVRHLRNRR